MRGTRSPQHAEQSCGTLLSETLKQMLVDTSARNSEVDARDTSAPVRWAGERDTLVRTAEALAVGQLTNMNSINTLLNSIFINSFLPCLSLFGNESNR